MTDPVPPWQRKARRGNGRAQPLSQDVIVDVGLKVLAAEGLDAVTMRRVAKDLDTGAASLYVHVTNKDDLHGLMLDRVVGEIPLPEPDPQRWPDQVRELARAELAALLSHPGIARIMMTLLVPSGPNLLRFGETMLGVLHAGGLSDRQAAYASDAIGAYVKAFALEASMWANTEFDPEELRRRGAALMDYVRALPDQFPYTATLAGMFGEHNAGERFEFGLDAILTGLAALEK